MAAVLEPVTQRHGTGAMATSQRADRSAAAEEVLPAGSRAGMGLGPGLERAAGRLAPAVGRRRDHRTAARKAGGETAIGGGTGQVPDREGTGLENRNCHGRTIERDMDCARPAAGVRFGTGTADLR